MKECWNGLNSMGAKMSPKNDGLSLTKFTHTMYKPESFIFNSPRHAMMTLILKKKRQS